MGHYLHIHYCYMQYTLALEGIHSLLYVYKICWAPVQGMGHPFNSFILSSMLQALLICLQAFYALSRREYLQGMGHHLSICIHSSMLQALPMPLQAFCALPCRQRWPFCAIGTVHVWFHTFCTKWLCNRAHMISSPRPSRFSACNIERLGWVWVRGYFCSISGCVGVEGGC